MAREVLCPRCGMPQTPGVPCEACAAPVTDLPRRIPTAQPVGETTTKRRSSEGVLRFALRGAIGFGLGAGIASLWVASILFFDFSPGIGYLGELSWLVAGFAMSGACGGAVLGWKSNTPGSSVIAAFGFAVGFALPGWLFPLTLRVLEDAAPLGSAFDRALYGSFLWAGVLGVAGAIGAAPLRSAFRVTSRHFLKYSVVAAAIAFGLGGAVGGAVALAYSLSSGSFRYWPFFTALFIAYTIGGALLGTAVGLKAKSPPGWKS